MTAHEYFIQIERTLSISTYPIDVEILRYNITTEFASFN